MEYPAAVAAVMDRYEQYVNPSWARLLRLMGLDDVEVEAEGCLVRDSRGREFIDCLGGYGVFNLGHRHPRVVEAFLRQFQRQPLASRTLFAGPMAELAERLARLTPGELRYSFFGHSGAEAVEGALKLARMATRRQQILSTQGAFHGKTFGALSASGRDVFRKPVEPLVPGIVHVPFGDAEAMEAAVTPQTAAVIVEPIQGEGGVVVPPAGYLKRLREICDQNGALLILDEVQTGLGRTGTLFACEQEGVVPDIMTLAKALGGGVAALGAFVASERAWAPFLEDPFLHTTSVVDLAACAAGCAALDVLVEEDLPGRARALGEQVFPELRGLAERYPEVLAEVRGRGLLIGLRFREEGQGGMVMAEMISRGILVGFTWNNPQIVRLEPPLVITESQLERVLTALGEALESARQLSSYR